MVSPQIAASPRPCAIRSSSRAMRRPPIASPYCRAGRGGEQGRDGGDPPRITPHAVANGLERSFSTPGGEPRSARPRVGAQPLVVFSLWCKILQRLYGLGGCKSARPGGGRALRGGAQARLDSAHWSQDPNARLRPTLPILAWHAAPSTPN